MVFQSRRYSIEDRVLQQDILIFGDLSAKPPVKGQPYGVLVYFYVHKILGWVLGSFLVAGLGGLTQKN